jgi:hypothetical protein
VLATLDLAPALPQVVGDRTQLQQVIAEANPRRVTRTNANEIGERNPTQFHSMVLYSSSNISFL